MLLSFVQALLASIVPHDARCTIVYVALQQTPKLIEEARAALDKVEAVLKAGTGDTIGVHRALA
jgi:hypothetical protein